MFLFNDFLKGKPSEMKKGILSFNVTVCYLKMMSLLTSFCIFTSIMLLICGYRSVISAVAIKLSM